MVSSRLPDDPIRHVVHLILENRSFDQMLGCMKAVYPDLDGVDITGLKSNEDTAGQVYTQAATQVRQMLKWDPHHEVPRVAVQLENGNSGFVKDFSQQYPDSTCGARQQIMDYYDLDFLPALHALGRNFKICDRWFSSLPGPTWPNRFFALTGTSNGRVNMPSDGTNKADLPGYFQQTQTTLFDRLNEQAVHWKVYFHDIPQTTVLDGQRQPHNVARYFYVSQLYEDAQGPESEFPEYCLIEPDFMGYGQNDGHPPHDIMRSEKLIADVYNALRANDELWRSTLLIVMFDEHGGFYDHVVPPTAVPPDEAKPSEYTFDQLGVRVPVLLVSPWVKPGVDHTQFDHTSVLKYLTEKWGLGPLGSRTAAATSIGKVITGPPVESGQTRISLSATQLQPPDPRAEEEAFGASSSHQAALAQLAQWLEIEAMEKAPRIAVLLAKMAEAAKAFAERYILGPDGGFSVSIAQPDKLSLPLQTLATDSVASFMMRMKRYAAMGLQTRLGAADLAADQQHHSLQTLALISGRNFHLEDEAEKLDNAKAWLSKGVANPPIKVAVGTGTAVRE
jgi:phospholipase C